MPSLQEIRWGRELSKKGAQHVEYVSKLGEKEYEFDHPPSDQDVCQAMLEDLEQHKKDCAGCGQSMLDEARQKVREKLGR